MEISFFLFFILFLLRLILSPYKGISIFKSRETLALDILNKLKNVSSNIRFIQMNDQYFIVKNKIHSSQYWIRNYYISDIKIDYMSMTTSNFEFNVISDNFATLVAQKIGLVMSAKLSLNWENYFLGQIWNKGNFSCEMNSTKFNISVGFFSDDIIPLFDISTNWIISNCIVKGRYNVQDIRKALENKVNEISNRNIITTFINEFTDEFFDYILYSNTFKKISFLQNNTEEVFLLNELSSFVINNQPISEQGLWLNYETSFYSFKKGIKSSLSYLYNFDIKYSKPELAIVFPPLIFSDYMNFYGLLNDLSFTISPDKINQIYNYNVTLNDLARIYTNLYESNNLDLQFYIKCNITYYGFSAMDSSSLILNYMCQINSKIPNIKIFDFKIGLEFFISISQYYSLNNNLVLNIEFLPKDIKHLSTSISNKQLNNNLFIEWLFPIVQSIPSFDFKINTFPPDEAPDCVSFRTTFDQDLIMLVVSDCNYS